jgi:antitoxin FitA
MRAHAIIDSRTESEFDMPQLIVRQIEERVVKKLKQQAGEHGVSMEEEHRRILRESLLGKAGRRASFKEALLAMPNVGKDADFERGPQLERAIDL